MFFFYVFYCYYYRCLEKKTAEEHREANKFRFPEISTDSIFIVRKRYREGDNTEKKSTYYF